jgi:hypothetical protein
MTTMRVVCEFDVQEIAVGRFRAVGDNGLLVVFGSTLLEVRTKLYDLCTDRFYEPTTLEILTQE